MRPRSRSLRFGLAPVGHAGGLQEPVERRVVPVGRSEEKVPGPVTQGRSELSLGFRELPRVRRVAAEGPQEGEREPPFLPLGR